MNAVGAVVSDCRRTVSFDREAVAADLDTSAVVTTSSVADDLERILSRLPLDDLRQAVVVAGEDPARETLIEELAKSGIRAVTISPYVGDANPDRADALVAGAANAAIATMPARDGFATGSLPNDESVVVVGDATAAADLAGTVDVTLVANGRELSTEKLPAAVDIVPGQARALEHLSDGYAVRVARRVTDDCTGCGRCVREYPEDTTAIPIDVVTDSAMGNVCPVDAIKPADDPAIANLSADQVVWPGYGGEPADTKWVHTDTANISVKVSRAGRIRDRPAVSVDGSVCAVGKRQHDGCTACRDACPNDAITITTGEKGSVTINDDRCVGCGTCVSVCPTGAIDPVQTFELDAFADAVRAGVEPVLDASGSLLPFSGDEPFALAFVDKGVERQAERAMAARSVPAVVPIRVPNTLHVPDVAVLYAVALGADGVLLAADPAKDIEPVHDTADSAKRVLDEFGLDAEVTVAASRSPDELADSMAASVPEQSLPGAIEGTVDTDSRRAMGQDVTAGLAGEHGSGPVEVTVPGGGDVAIESSACTLCETCGNLCPTDALTQESGTLRFDPSACVGCGLCEESCPEDAIEVSQTVSISESGVGEEYVAVEKDLVKCSVCGRPFAPQDGLDAIREQLDEDALEAIDLEVCPSCRQHSPPDTDVRIPR